MVASAQGERIGNYRIVRLLGEGGMAAVYEVVHEQIGRRAAIKLLKPDASKQKELVRRFLDEARAVNLLKHPGIVEIQDFQILPSGAPYAIMEYLDGVTLQQHLADNHGALPTQEALDVSQQIALAMAAMHKRRQDPSQTVHPLRAMSGA